MSKGEATVPAEIRENPNLKAGAKIRHVHSNGSVFIKAKNKRAIDLLGKFHDPNRTPVTDDEMNEAIGEAIAGRVQGSR